MGKKQSEKRKKASSSGDENISTPKQCKHGGPADTANFEEVSDILNKTRSVLFDDSINVFQDCSTPLSTKSVKDYTSVTNAPVAESSMASNSADSAAMQQQQRQQQQQQQQQQQPSCNEEIITYLRKIDSKLDNVEQKLQKLETLEKKVDSFEKDLKTLWSQFGKHSKTIDDQMMKVDERLDNVEFQSCERADRLDDLVKENEKLKDSIAYLQSQSMRNNLIFCNIDELPNEKPSDTEAILRGFMVDKLKLAQDYVQSIGIERAHRMGTHAEGPRARQSRKIVCKFTLFKDRESVRRKRVELEGTRFYLHEQFPPEVAAKRRQLVPKLRQAKQEGKNAWIAYDTLYIDGKVVKTG